MSTHTTHPPRADQTDQAAEPARRAPCLDERGIALQTVIIMVVLLAIAGGVAAVLFSRGQSATQQLEAQNIASAPAVDYTSKTLCNSVSGLKWDDSSSTPGKQCRYKTGTACKAAGGVLATAANAGQQSSVDNNDCVSVDTATGKYLGEVINPST